MSRFITHIFQILKNSKNKNLTPPPSTRRNISPLPPVKDERRGARRENFIKRTSQPILENESSNIKLHLEVT
jgi:hypothetical protein